MMKWTGIIAGMCLAMVSLSTCQDQGCGDVMCAMYCEYGYKVDNTGCSICECNTQTEIKGGQCPIVDPDIVGTCDERCEHDGVCPGDQKCCSNGCGHVCMNPVRPGYCSVSDFGICGGISCTVDSDCSQNNTFKCCKNACGAFTCIPPAEEKRGTCPTGSLPEGSLGLCADICSQDQDCPALQKCCSNGCGHVCITPADLPEIHSGSCPAVPEGSLGICANVCANDGTCGENEKCCQNACGGYSCVAAVNDKPECAAFMCLRWCPYGFKVENGCNICDCQEPTLIRAGECPVVEGGTLGICVDSCDHDGECAENQKCCSNGCGHACVAISTTPADPKGCPNNALEGSVGICSESCGTGQPECTSGQLCCSNGCGHACTDSVTVHMGECPIGNLTKGSIGACVEMCSYDGECATNQKCCSNGCGHVCITVANDQPGSCPDVTCLIFCEYGNKKDSNGCNICECQGPAEAMVERPGECPIGLLPEGIVGICSEECSSDFECTNTTQKCCSNGCGHVCTDALNVGPRCPPVCQRYCEFGNVEDENGCDTCQCNEEKTCDKVTCQLHCAYGYKENTEGCNVCECEDKPSGCPDTICALFCPFGLQRDAEGCEVCTCTSSALASFSTAGECPAPSGNTAAGSCSDLCDIDSECNEGEKCCYNGCGHTCVGPNGNGANVASPIMLLLLTLLSVIVMSTL